MKYFLLGTDPAYENCPHITGWFSEIDPRNINPITYKKLPRRTLLRIESNPKTVYTDIIDFPFFLISQTVKSVFEVYRLDIKYREIILLDSENEKATIYYLPIFQHIDCLSSKSKLSRDKSILKKAVIKYPPVEDALIFCLAGLNANYVAARIDLVESILQRPVLGVGLTPVELEYNGQEEPA